MFETIQYAVPGARVASAFFIISSAYSVHRRSKLLSLHQPSLSARGRKFSHFYIFDMNFAYYRWRKAKCIANLLCVLRMREIDVVFLSPLPYCVRPAHPSNTREASVLVDCHRRYHFGIARQWAKLSLENLWQLFFLCFIKNENGESSK